MPFWNLLSLPLCLGISNCNSCNNCNFPDSFSYGQGRREEDSELSTVHKWWHDDDSRYDGGESGGHLEGRKGNWAVLEPGKVPLISDWTQSNRLKMNEQRINLFQWKCFCIYEIIQGKSWMLYLVRVVNWWSQALFTNEKPIDKKKRASSDLGIQDRVKVFFLQLNAQRWIVKLINIFTGFSPLKLFLILLPRDKQRKNRKHGNM